MGKQRPIQLVDHFGCTMAAISEQAFAIAAPRREGSGPDSVRRIAAGIHAL